jgi:hypothetical protein
LILQLPDEPGGVRLEAGEDDGPLLPMLENYLNKGNTAAVSEHVSSEWCSKSATIIDP